MDKTYKNNRLSKIIGVVALTVAVLAYVMATYINGSSYLNNSYPVVFFQVLYLIIGIVSLGSAIAFIVAAVKISSWIYKLLFSLASVATLYMTTQYVFASILSGGIY